VLDNGQGNGTSVLHRFPYAGINFFCYEHLKLSLKEGKVYLGCCSPSPGLMILMIMMMGFVP